MKIDMVPVGSFQANCYVLGCEKTGRGIVIDPGAESGRVLDVIKRMGVTVVAIVDTHAHVDHVGANQAVKKATGADLLIHEDDVPYLRDSLKNLSAFAGCSMKLSEPDRLLKEGDVVRAGDISLQVIHTPGHTPGGICLYGHGMLFSGDTLFAGSIGRTDFPGGDFKALIDSIKSKILVLPEEVVVYPGHGPCTTVGEEKQGNPFL